MTTIYSTIDTGREINAPALPQSSWNHGYEYMELAEHHGWSAISSWGKDGWDLGAWPYVIIFCRARSQSTDNTWGIGQYVEGDLETKYYETREAYIEAIDRMAFGHWQFNTDQAPPNLPKDFEDLPEEYRGMPQL